MNSAATAITSEKTIAESVAFPVAVSVSQVTLSCPAAFSVLIVPAVVGGSCCDVVIEEERCKGVSGAGSVSGTTTLDIEQAIVVVIDLIDGSATDDLCSKEDTKCIFNMDVGWEWVVEVANEVVFSSHDDEMNDVENTFHDDPRVVFIANEGADDKCDSCGANVLDIAVSERLGRDNSDCESQIFEDAGLEDKLIRENDIAVSLSEVLENSDAVRIEDVIGCIDKSESCKVVGKFDFCVDDGDFIAVVNAGVLCSELSSLLTPKLQPTEDFTDSGIFVNKEWLDFEKCENDAIMLLSNVQFRPYQPKLQIFLPVEGSHL